MLRIITKYVIVEFDPRGAGLLTLLLPYLAQFWQ